MPLPVAVDGHSQCLGATGTGLIADRGRNQVVDGRVATRPVGAAHRQGAPGSLRIGGRQRHQVEPGRHPVGGFEPGVVELGGPGRLAGLVAQTEDDRAHDPGAVGKPGVHRKGMAPGRTPCRRGGRRPASPAPSGRGPRNALITQGRRRQRAQLALVAQPLLERVPRRPGLEEPRADSPAGKASDVHGQGGGWVLLGSGKTGLEAGAEEGRRRVPEKPVQRRELDDIGHPPGRGAPRGRGPADRPGPAGPAPRPARCRRTPTGPPGISLSGSKHRSS